MIETATSRLQIGANELSNIFELFSPDLLLRKTLISKNWLNGALVFAQLIFSTAKVSKKLAVNIFMNDDLQLDSSGCWMRKAAEGFNKIPLLSAEHLSGMAGYFDAVSVTDCYEHDAISKAQE
jgi:hypothetical protein